jgi:hypothetical protein
MPDPVAQQELNDYKDKLFRAIKRFHEPKTGWELLQREWATVEPRGDGGKNTNYLNTQIQLSDIKLWPKFPTFDDIFAFSKSTALLKENFHELELPVIADDQHWSDQYFKGLNLPPAFAETNVVEVMYPFFRQLNALLRLATYEGPTGKGNWVVIGGGKGAMERRFGGTPERKDPDRATFWTDGTNAVGDPRSRKSQDATNIPCLLVGDYKMASKFSQKMLLEACEKENHVEAQKVLNQVHDYMDMHHDRFGYIITEVELVMFRRRNDNEKWGQIDFSPAIPIHAPEGSLNALMVLWYFHIKYVVMNLEEGYKLPSFYHNCPKELGGGRYPDRKSDGVASKVSTKGGRGKDNGRFPKKSASRITSSRLGSTASKR